MLVDDNRWQGDYRDLDARRFEDVQFPCPVPGCEASTVLRYADHSVYENKPFYGCAKFPDCDSITCIDGTVRRPGNPEQEARNREMLQQAARRHEDALQLARTLDIGCVVFHADYGRGEVLSFDDSFAQVRFRLHSGRPTRVSRDQIRRVG